ncbi:MAG: response regulator [Actinomyces sp.]|uniref:response regulator transcription factor n=1 Tax=Actinomyces sp. TaxID=29317 RepID=UPI0026DC52C5|nr:response regulator [Actinomyces sp.]MDO4244378.1 response regulator [Actinomyces sp.]
MHTDVLLVEDETEMADAVADYLTAFGLTCRHVSTAEDGLAVLAQDTVGVVVLDVNLPGMNGFAFCRDLRARCTTPGTGGGLHGGADGAVAPEPEPAPGTGPGTNPAPATGPGASRPGGRLPR